MSERRNLQIIIPDSDSESESTTIECEEPIHEKEEDAKTKQQRLAREARIADMDMTIKIHHLLVARETLQQRGQPILFHVESGRSNESKLYAWYPTGPEEQRTMVLDIFYVMLADRAQVDNLRILTDCFIGLLATNSKLQAAKESAQQLLTECFGSYQLGTIKRVIRPYEETQRKYGDVDFYLVPQRVQTYTLLAR